jgi:NitT/TauT family transport system substrate-binding protein
LLRAAKWVEANPAAAARLSVEKKYLASTVEQNAVSIAALRYVPSVSGAELAVKQAAAEMKASKMLAPSTDVDELVKRTFVYLDGVTDEWINTLPVEKLADGQVPRAWLLRDYALHSSEAFCGLCLIPPVK